MLDRGVKRMGTHALYDARHNVCFVTSIQRSLQCVAHSAIVQVLLLLEASWCTNHPFGIRELSRQLDRRN